MRLSDAGPRRPKSKLIYPDHRSSPWPTEAIAPRSLEPIVRRLTGTVRYGHEREGLQHRIRPNILRPANPCERTLGPA